MASNQQRGAAKKKAPAKKAAAKKKAPAKKRAAAKKAAAKKVAATRAAFDYRNHVVEIEVEGTAERLLVDGNEHECRRDPDTGAYFSSEMPYLRFGSAEELGQAIVDAADGG